MENLRRALSEQPEIIGLCVVFLLFFVMGLLIGLLINNIREAGMTNDIFLLKQKVELLENQVYAMKTLDSLPNYNEYLNFMIDKEMYVNKH